MSSKRITKSVRLKKYEMIYKELLNPKNKDREEHQGKSKKSKKSEKNNFPKEEEEKKNTHVKPKINIRTSTQDLNNYQQFFQQESSKSKYKNMKGSERMTAIAESWEKEKRRQRRRKKAV